MYALFIVLNRIDYLDEILINFMEKGIQGATVLDSQGMAGTIVEAQESGVTFNLLKHFLDDCKPYNKTIVTVLESEKEVENAVTLVKQTLGDDAKQGAGFMFTVPVGTVFRFEE